MNLKIYKLWMMLLDSPGEWLYSDDIAFKLDLTRKQLYTILSKLPSPPVEKNRSDCMYGVQVRIVGSEPYLAKVRERLLKEQFRIDDELLDRIYDALSSAGWMTIGDLSADTGMSVHQLSKAVSMMDNIECCNMHGVPMYRRLSEGRNTHV